MGIFRFKAGIAILNAGILRFNENISALNTDILKFIADINAVEMYFVVTAKKISTIRICGERYLKIGVNSHLSDIRLPVNSRKFLHNMAQLQKNGVLPTKDARLTGMILRLKKY